MANTSLTTQKQAGIASYLSGEAVRKNISNVIGEKNTARFVTAVVSAVQANPQLAKCSNSSILTAALQGETLGLAPSPQLGQFYMTPYKNKKKIGNQWVEVDEAQFSLGYKGLIQLAIRSGQYRTIVVSDIKEGEVTFNPITEELTMDPILDPAVREAAKTVGYFASFELLNGFKKQLYSPIEQIESHAYKYSRSYRYDRDNNKKSSPWSTNFDAMAKKTMIRRLISTWGIMSIDMQKAYVNDMAVIDENNRPVYVDNPQSGNLETQVQEDIANNANAKAFDEDVVETDVVEAEVSPAPEKPKRGRPRKTEEPVMEMPAEEPAPAPVAPDPELFPEMTAIDDDPDWA